MLLSHHDGARDHFNDRRVELLYRLWSALSCAILCFFLIGWLAPSISLGQSKSDQDSAEQKPQDSKSKGIKIDVNRPQGVTRTRPDRWMVMGAVIGNLKEREATVVATTFHVDAKKEQFGREFWIPPKSVRQVWYPMKFSAEPTSENRIDIHTRIYDKVAGREIAVRSSLGYLYQQDTIQFDDDADITATISDPDKLPFEVIESPYEAVCAMRVSAGLSRRTYNFYPDFFPRIKENLDNVDQLIVYAKELEDSPRAINAIREWIHDGGTCWIMAEKTGCDLANRLIGTTSQIESLETIELTDFEMTRGDDARKGQVVLERSFDFPIKMERVFVDNADVRYEVDGWPAGFWMQVGNGKVLVTTLETKAWVRERKEGDARSSRNFDNTLYVCSRPLEELTSDLFNPVEKLSLQQDSINEIHQSAIGFKIASKYLIGTILILLCVFLCVIGYLLSRMERLHYMLGVAPILSLGVGGLIFGFGYNSQTNISETFAETQLVNVHPGGEFASVDGRVTVFNQAAETKSIVSDSGGTFANVEEAKFSSAITRLMWNDQDDWVWEKKKLNTGLNAGSYSQSRELPNPVQVFARYSEDGLEGEIQVDDDFGEIRNAVLLTQKGYIPLTIDSSNRFSFMGGGVATNRFIASSILSDNDRMHQKVYEGLFKNAPEIPVLESPQLAFWSKSIPSGLNVTDDHRKGDALYLCPIQFRSGAVGSQITIDDRFLSYRSVSLKKQSTGSTAYNARKDQFTPMRQSSNLILRIQIPSNVTNFVADQLEIDFEIDGAGRTLDVQSYLAGKPTTIKSIEGAEGSYSIELDQSKFEIDEYDGILVGFNIRPIAGEHDPKSGIKTWSFRDIRFRLSGTLSD